MGRISQIVSEIPQQIPQHREYLWDTCRPRYSRRTRLTRMKFFSRLLSFPFLVCLTLSTTPLRAQGIAGNFVIKLEPNAYSLESTRSMANSVNSLLGFEKIVLQSLENNNLSLACKLQIFSTFRTHHRGVDAINEQMTILADSESLVPLTTNLMNTLTVNLDKDFRLIDRFCK